MTEPVSSSIASTALSAGFNFLIKKMVAGVLEAATSPLKAVIGEATVNLEPHLQMNYDRCLKIKTILNRHEPVDLLKIYVNTKFKSGKKTLDDYDLIDLLPKIRRAVISGTGGGGKTVFMKYLWLSLFARAEGKVPLFLELRRLNDITSDDILIYIYRSIIEMSSTMSIEHFERAVHEGIFTFIFDGFDEIHGDKKNGIEKQILKLAQNHQNAFIIISGRPDPRFDAWQSFTNFAVQPLSKDQSIKLIGKLDYDKKIKQKFVENVKKDLYDKHKSFLSNPLLATMMLLTFDQFAEIPEKMFLFYEQAFDTLFLKHDATKEGFQRKKHTDITIDIFKKYLSYFCLFTYFNEKFEFTDSELGEYTQKALTANDSNLLSSTFIDDLTESVCILQREGLQTIFTHRSFQEYFAAYCLSNFIDEHCIDILMKICSRWNDNVVKMLFEMNREKVERQFIVPVMTEIVKDVRNNGADKSIEAHSRYFGFRPVAERRGSQYIIFPIGGNEKWAFVMTVLNLYRETYFSDSEKKISNDYPVITGYLESKARLKKTSRGRVTAGLCVFGNEGDEDLQEFSGIRPPGDERKVRAKVDLLPFSVLDKTSFAEVIREHIVKHDRLLKQIAKQSHARAKKIEDILGLAKPKIGIGS